MVVKDDLVADDSRASGLPEDEFAESTTPLEAEAAAADEVVDSEIESTDESVEVEAVNEGELTPDGLELADEDLADPPAEVEVAADETEAEELLDADDTVDATPDKADPRDVEIADEDQLDEATEQARAAKSSKPKPIKRNQTVAPVRKTKPTPKRDDASKTVVRKRTTPVDFVQQSVGELKKVVWPSAATTQQYFFVVLVFVLFIMFFVAGLDALFGWLLLLWLS